MLSGVVASSRRRDGTYERVFSLTGGQTTWYPLTDAGALGIWNDFTGQSSGVSGQAKITSGTWQGLGLVEGSNPFIKFDSCQTPNSGVCFVRNDQGYFTFNTEEQGYIDAEEGAMWIDGWIATVQQSGNPKTGLGFRFYNASNEVTGQVYLYENQFDTWKNMTGYLRIPPGTTKYKPSWNAMRNGSANSIRSAFGGIEEMKFVRVNPPVWTAATGFNSASWGSITGQDNTVTLFQTYNTNGFRAVGNTWKWKNRSNTGLPISSVQPINSVTQYPYHIKFECFAHVNTEELIALCFMDDLVAGWNASNQWGLILGGVDASPKSDPAWLVASLQPVAGQVPDATNCTVYGYHTDSWAYHGIPASASIDEHVNGIQRVFYVADDDAGATADLRIWNVFYSKDETIAPFGT